MNTAAAHPGLATVERRAPGFQVAARSAIAILPAAVVAHDPKTNRWIQTGPACLKKILAEFDKAMLDPLATGILVDFDHDTRQAAGWIESLEIRPDAMWATVAWTALGLAAIQGGLYRRISPGCQVDAVFGSERLPTEHQGIEHVLRWQPSLLQHVSLTNDPLFTTLPPIEPPAVEAPLPAAPRDALTSFLESVPASVAREITLTFRRPAP